MDRHAAVEPTRTDSNDYRRDSDNIQITRRTSQTSSATQDPLQTTSSTATAEMPPTSSSRRRATRGTDEHSSADESAPIIPRANSSNTHRDYQSISPSISARGAESGSGATGTQQEGTANIDSARKPGRSASAEREAADVERKESGWWRGFLEKYGSVELENKASVARDHLALERTFLAWLRTSLSFASIGIAVTQLFRLNTSIASNPSSANPSKPSSPSPSDSNTRLRHVGKPLGATFIAVSIIILFIGFHRYFEAQHYVIRGKFPASRGSVLVVSAIAGALIVSSLVVILVVAPRAFES